MNLEFAAKDVVKAVQRGDVIIVIDVLRCSSTIIVALTNGAKGIIPIETVEEARGHRQDHLDFILAGERKGLKPEGFDLGNSPLEFSHEKVSRKHIVLTTTSGTRAISKSKGAKWVLIGAFLNAEAVADAALKLSGKEHAGISFVLAGKKGSFSLEDFLCAGAIANYFPADRVEFSDGASAAVLAFKQAQISLEEAVQRGGHAQYLERRGLGEDVKFCSRMNVLMVVPVLKEGKIVPLEV